MARATHPACCPGRLSGGSSRPPPGDTASGPRGCLMHHETVVIRANCSGGQSTFAAWTAMHSPRGARRGGRVLLPVEDLLAGRPLAGACARPRNPNISTPAPAKHRGGDVDLEFRGRQSPGADGGVRILIGLGLPWFPWCAEERARCRRWRREQRQWNDGRFSGGAGVSHRRGARVAEQLDLPPVAACALPVRSP